MFGKRKNNRCNRMGSVIITLQVRIIFPEMSDNKSLRHSVFGNGSIKSGFADAPQLFCFKAFLFLLRSNFLLPLQSKHFIFCSFFFRNNFAVFVETADFSCPFKDFRCSRMNIVMILQRNSFIMNTKIIFCGCDQNCFFIVRAAHS